jgi:hypothetical protein
MPPEIALRVVSLPATTSRKKNMLKSRPPSFSPSTSACTSTETMSSFGSARRRSASHAPYWTSSRIASCASTGLP